jgi:hypothetical protein
MKFFANKIKDSLEFESEKRWTDHISSLSEGRYTIEVLKYKKNRSGRQNNYYWLYLSVISDETGDDSINLHEYFKRKFLPPRFIKILGREVKLPASTTKLNSAEFTNYIMRIEAETGILSPDPNKYL